MRSKWVYSQVEGRAISLVFTPGWQSLKHVITGRLSHTQYPHTSPCSPAKFTPDRNACLGTRRPVWLPMAGKWPGDMSLINICLTCIVSMMPNFNPIRKIKIETTAKHVIILSCVMDIQTSKWTLFMGTSRTNPRVSINAAFFDFSLNWTWPLQIITSLRMSWCSAN